MVGRNVLSAAALLMILLMAGSAFAEEGAADLTTDTARLAVLASTMQAIAERGTDSYTLDCGRGKFDTAEDTVDLMPKDSLQGEYYCILKKGDKLLFGTFGEGGTDKIEQSILRVYKDANYNAQFTAATDIKDSACSLGSGGIILSTEFQECKDAIKGLRTYVAYDKMDSTAVYILVSDSPLDTFAQEQGFLDGIIAFFTGLFGETSAEELAASQQEFHHAYFARQGSEPLRMRATWMDDTAILTYENFGTKISDSRPENSDFRLGNGNRQVVTLELDNEDIEDIRQWRRLTSGLRITDKNLPPQQGDVCGNNEIGADEECDGTATMPLTDCRHYNPLYSTGSLSCIQKGAPNECMYDTSACISCDDGDKDGYSGGAGAKGAFATISNTFKLGTATPQGPFSDETKDILNARTRSLGIGYSIIPVTYDMAFPQGGAGATAFETALTTATASYQTCINQFSTQTAANKEECLKERFTPQAFAIASGHAMQSVLHWQAPATARPCVPAEGAVSCPDGYSPAAAGIADQYSSILPALKRMDVTPILRITLGSCGSKDDCGMFAYSADSDQKWKTTSGLPTDATVDDAMLRKTRAYCMIVADGTAGYWKSLPSYQDSDSVPSHFIVIGDPAQANSSGGDYLKIYSACKAGIESALGPGAVVLYGVPSDVADEPLSTNEFTEGIHSTPSIVDGIYIEQEINGNAYAAPSFDKLVKRNMLLSTFKRPIYSRMTIAASEQTLYGASLLAMHARAGTSVLLYDDMGQPSRKLMKVFVDGTAKEELLPTTRHWQAVADGLASPAFAWSGSQSFSNGAKLPDGMALIGANRPDDKSTLTILNANPGETTVNLPLSGCAQGTAAFVLSTESKTGPFTGKIPGNSTVTLPLGKDLACLYPSTTSGDAASCRTVVDCNDTSSDIHPGADEACDNGFDDNCDGRVDEPECEDATIITPPASICDYDGICEGSANGGSETQSCADCVAGSGVCPTPSQQFSVSGKMTISVRRNSTNGPEIAFKSSDTVNCKVLYALPLHAGVTKDIFIDGTSKVVLTSGSDKWQLSTSGTLTEKIKSCWGVSAPVNIVVPFSAAPQCADKIACIDDGRACYYATDCCTEYGTHVSCTQNVCTYTVRDKPTGPEYQQAP